MHLPKDTECASARSKLFLDIARHIQELWHLPVGMRDEAAEMPDRQTQEADSAVGNATIADASSAQVQPTALQNGDGTVEEDRPHAQIVSQGHVGLY